MDITDKTFDEKVLEGSKKIPVVVDFWAPWCGPCRAISPILEKIQKSYEGKIQVYKLNVDENQKMATKYKVMSIPNVKMFKGGKPIAEFVGAQPESAIRQWIEKYI